ncbi:cell division initiation protein [Enterococcus sp. PF1-24]|uniref:DivIVA domain-containing protein n=1 Tax=unclassified Enterococcus TaxID=2608891 RepID=UPI002475C9BD|nr:MULTISPECIES: DivIVA domain-containing protein [unclassified Enterococcus]MDH6364452.1 cell division initiation protein [Enterococcus sp. PFB1-1]MDH6401525.1 cell division initiation protein [Enterococcus sp. PF1-24]
MALTPLDIQNKSFSQKLRGYSPDEVEDFLELIVRDYEELISKNREMEKALKHSEEKLEYFNELKDALNQSIIVAQDTADKVKDNASKESEVIVTSAQNRANELVTTAETRANNLTAASEEKAREIIEDATSKAKRLASETDDLKKRTRVFHQRLSLMLESQLEQMKTDEWDEILEPFSNYVNDSHVVIKELLASEFDKNESTDVESDETDSEEFYQEEDE